MNTLATSGQSPLEDTMLTALISGMSSAAVVSCITYPLDLVKTQSQLNNYRALKEFNVPSNHPTTLAHYFKGCSALVLGNVIKNSARIFSYHLTSNFMAIESTDANGNHSKKTTAPRIVIAGIMSGFLESLWIIPFENIKITMIQNMTLGQEILLVHGSDPTGYSIPSKHHKPAKNIFTSQYVSPHAYFTSEILNQYKGNNSVSKFTPSTHIVKHTRLDALKHKYNRSPSQTFFGTVKEIYSIKGVKGFGYGGLITLVRQTSTSVIWLSSYNWTKQLIFPHHKGGEGWFSDQYTLVQSLGLHLAAASAVIATTQPVDFVKSHMQSKNSHTAYKDSLSTAYRIFVENSHTGITDGIRVFYRGSLARGCKVLVSGGLSAFCYVFFQELISTANSKTVFTSE